MANRMRRRKFLGMATVGLALPPMAKAIHLDSLASPVDVMATSISAKTAASEDSIPAKGLDALEQANQIAKLSRIGKGEYAKPRLKKLGEQRELKYDFHFEETAPGRNSASNEWSAYGVTGGNNAFNNMGRDMRVRYPVFDLVFRLYEGEKEISPGDLDSFRLGLVRNNLPAIWGAWEYDGLLYKVSVMAILFDEQGNAFDLYKLEVQNRGTAPAKSRLAVGLDGPPDMRLEGDAVHGLGDALFLLVDQPEKDWLITRDWGLLDKRAKSYDRDGVPGVYAPAIVTTRIGLDGLPVAYRVKAAAGEPYTIYLAASPAIDRLLAQPKKAGDLLFKYEVEGAAPQTVDWIGYSAPNSPPICLRFDGACDVNGDGYIEIVARNAENSRLKHTRLSAIYIFPVGFKVEDLQAVYSGSLTKQCVRFIDVGSTPEVSSVNQTYDTSDVGLCRFNLGYGGRLLPGERKTYWLKVPPIHRRQPGSMGALSHAFLQVLPGEAVPPFGSEQITQLRNWSPVEAEQKVIALWDKFYGRAARIETPDPVLKDVYLSRLSTRAILDVKINDQVWFNACSPWFYYDFAYRDQAYVVHAYDLAGLHDLAERLLRVYCMDVKDVPKGPISFGDEPLQLGMDAAGLWITRPGQYDAQGQNLWALVEHYKLSGDREWLERIAYGHIRRGAMWIVNSRHKHMEEIKDAHDPRYGLIQAGAMEVTHMVKGMHQYYMDAWAVLGLQEAGDAAGALGLVADQKLFAQEARDLKASLHKSFRQTFKRTGLYEGYLWFGVEKEGEGMYNFWGHTPLVWPTHALDGHDPMLTGTFRMMERMANQWGGGLYSDEASGCWPYISVDWAISYILRGEPERTLDIFCAFTDTAGLTLSWGEGYRNEKNTASGDQPHFWADAQWVTLYRHLFVMEDDSTLLLTPATLRRWQQGNRPVALVGVPTQFGYLDLTIEPRPDGSQLDYRFKLAPKGDQASRELQKIVVNARTPCGRKATRVSLDGQPYENFFGEEVLIPRPERNKEYRLRIDIG